MNQPDQRLIDVVEKGVREELKIKIAEEYHAAGKPLVQAYADADTYLKTQSGFTTVLNEMNNVLAHYNLHFNLADHIIYIHKNTSLTRSIISNIISAVIIAILIPILLFILALLFKAYISDPTVLVLTKILDAINYVIQK